MHTGIDSMEYFRPSSPKIRRDFLKNLLGFSSLVWLGFPRLSELFEEKEKVQTPPEIIYKYRTISIDHFNELQNDIDMLKGADRLSTNKTYRSYIDKLRFEIPDQFPGARSVIVVAIFTRLMYATFHLKDQQYEVMVPPQYYDDGISTEDLKHVIQNEIIQEAGYRIEPADHVHLKLLAVRSGLGKYGRNNLCFVDGMGNFLTVYAFFTDFQFEEDHWHELAMLDLCTDCRICYGICPTNCITEEHFVIDVGKCITLYNEIEGTFPKWILTGMHNALIGCMKCQVRCPENEKLLHTAGKLEGITEAETRKILQGKPDEELLTSLSRKLRKFYPARSEEYFPIFTRNLGVLISSAPH